MVDLKRFLLLIFLCIITSFFYWYFDNESIIDLLVFSGASFFQGRFWTIITALFVHGNFLHLVGNMLFLYVFGSTLEEEVGASKTLSAFFIGGILSFLLSVYFYGPNTIMIGASAAIFTLTATVMLIKPLRFSWAFLMPLGLVAFLCFIYNALVVS
ncbi:MAG: rhomboid family intramembrane serine protease, partial [Candidatus Bathyarchaeia archaeon]